MDAEDKRYLRHWLRDFRRNSRALGEEEREKVVERKKRVSELCIDFQKNLNEDNSSLSFTLAELEGLPSDSVEGLEKKERDGGKGWVFIFAVLFKLILFIFLSFFFNILCFLSFLTLPAVKYVLTCKYPHVLPTLRQCKVQNTRHAMEEIFSNMCKDKKTKIAEEV